MIKRITEEYGANECDHLLSLLIADEKQYRHDTYSPFVVKDYFKNVIKNPENILLAEEIDNHLIGYVYLQPIGEAHRTGYLIDGLYVEKKYRGQGHGRRLLQKALEVLKTKDLDYLEIKVMTHNTIARKLYQSFGFEDQIITMQKSIKNVVNASKK